MLELLGGLPDNVIGLKAIGEVEDDDYDHVLVPEIEERLSRHDKIRILYVLGEGFEGYEGEAVWEDVKLGMRTFTSYERIALVTDSTLISRSVKAVGWLMPGDVRTYRMADVEEATEWVTS